MSARRFDSRHLIGLWPILISLLFMEFWCAVVAKPLSEQETLDQALESMDDAVFYKYRTNGNFGMPSGMFTMYTIDAGAARHFFDAAVIATPKNPDAWALLGLCCVEADRDREALTQVDKALALNPKCATALAVRGRVFFKMHRTNDATAELKKALQIDPKNFTAHEMLARNYADQLQDKPALSEFDELVKSHPHNVRAYLLRGNLLSRTGDTEGALRDFGESIKYGPHSSLAYMTRAKTLEKLARHREAIPDYLKVKDLDPSRFHWFSANCNAIHCYEATKQYEKALVLHEEYRPLHELAKMRTLSGMEVGELVDRANDCLALGQSDKALYAVSLVLKSKPHSAAAMQLRAKIYQHMGDHKKAISDFNTLLSWDKSIPEWYRGRAASYKALGQNDAAERDLKTAKELDDSY